MLSTEQLVRFDLEEMRRRFASDAPGLSPSLGHICRGKPGDCEIDGEKGAEGDVEDDPEPGMSRGGK